MEVKDYDELLGAIKTSASRIFELADSEEEVCRLEQVIHKEIMYLAAIAQSERVKPPEGWDPLGR